MAYLTDNVVSLSKRAAESANPQYFVAILASIALISVLTLFYHLLISPIFNVASNAVSIALVAYAAFTVFRSRHSSTTNVFYLAAACTFTCLSIVFNFPTASVVDGIKYLSIYVFYAAGHACAAKLRPVEIRYICFLAALPIFFFLAFGNSRIPELIQNNGTNIFSYFANMNVATLYFSALIFTLAERLGVRAIFLQFLNVALMNKIGVAVATIVAISVWIAVPLRKQSVIALAIFILVAIVAFWAGAFDRAIATVESMNLLAQLGPEVVSRLSFRELVQLTGTTDLSGFFRLMHWANIWDIYSSGSLGTLLFGYGIGQTPYLTVLHLVPHNDYLRILAEYGLINLAVFVCFLLHVLFNLKTGLTKVLFMVLLIYFFSENLVDHFVSMALYFTYAGRFSAMPGEDALEKALRSVRAWAAAERNN
ncbi:O-antigen ligase family protein [Bradyrhizobium sp. URHD0069]|uniref:O-antigen ligase family protein n=1 Tax=Bradyrhizobium sp. URHD0069 TaxID=1380355 RepID=UPI00068B1B03|nr:O-antigen ligase family protein [Bradyrhizobium sp. URHD0069]